MDVPLPNATIGGFAMAVVWVMFSYTGFNEAIYVASEARVGRRTVPLALLVGTLITTFLYFAINDVFLRSAPVADLAGQSQVAAVAAAALGGETARSGVVGGGAASSPPPLASLVMAVPAAAQPEPARRRLDRAPPSSAAASPRRIAVTWGSEFLS